MEEEIRKDLVPTLLERGVEWHTRRGIRQGCLCNFCLEKRWGTAYIGYTKFPYNRYRQMLLELHPDRCHCHYGSGVPFHPCHWTSAVDVEDLAREALKEERERKRNIVRSRLKFAKEEI